MGEELIHVQMSR